MSEQAAEADWMVPNTVHVCPDRLDCGRIVMERDADEMPASEDGTLCPDCGKVMDIREFVDRDRFLPSVREQARAEIRVQIEELEPEYRLDWVEAIEQVREEIFGGEEGLALVVENARHQARREVLTELFEELDGVADAEPENMLRSLIQHIHRVDHGDSPRAAQDVAGLIPVLSKFRPDPTAPSGWRDGP